MYWGRNRLASEGLEQRQGKPAKREKVTQDQGDIGDGVRQLSDQG